VIVLNTDTGKEVARVPVGGSADDVYFDAERKRIYVLGGEGFISAIQQTDPDHYALIANIPDNRRRAHRHFLWDELYAGVPAAGLEPAANLELWRAGIKCKSAGDLAG